MAQKDLEALIRLFNIPKKKEVERYARDLVITSEALSSLILTAQVAGLGAYKYACHHKEITPEHLEPSESERTALGTNGVGPIKGEARKFVTKINQIFKVRRLFSAHVFYSRSKAYWHMFYMDQRDYTKRENHWKHGPHIHYSNNCFTNESLDEVWQKVTAISPKPPSSVHIRYDYHHNRPK